VDEKQEIKLQWPMGVVLLATPLAQAEGSGVRASPESRGTMQCLSPTHESSLLCVDALCLSEGCGQ
jgi:hypothetical protein